MFRLGEDSPMQYRYRQPKNEDAFEEFCLVLLRDHWSLPTLDRYAHRGETQDGVDLLDTGGNDLLRAVQCKHHDVNKTLPPRELVKEVEKAKNFPQKIGEFFVFTTAKKSAATQRRVREINIEHARTGLFPVRLVTWDDIERIIDTSAAGQDFLNVQSPQATRTLLRSELQPIHDLVRAQGDDVHAGDLDEAKKQLDDGEVQSAVLLLARIKRKDWERLSSTNRARWCTLLADTALRQGNDVQAARALIEAKVHEPTSDAAVANEIIAYQLLNERARAFDLAIPAVAARPHSGSIYAAAIRSASTVEQLAGLMDKLPAHLREHPEVWVAAATRDDVQPSLQNAELTARRATALAPDDARGWSALGSLLLRTELDKSDPESAPTKVRPIRKRVEEAKACFTTVVDFASRRGIPGYKATALISRATASAYLGDVDAAHQDIEAARHAAPADAQVLVAAARMEEERGNHDQAVQLLRQVVMRKPDEEPRFLLAVAL